MRHSRALAKMRAGKPALVTNINAGVSPLLYEMVGKIGYDAVWLDMEHREWTWGEARQMITAGRAGGVDTMVRVRKGEGYTSFFRPFEDGAAGIMVPHVKTAAEAADIVRNAKYSPLGRRGFENVMYDADCALANPHEYLVHANRETFIAIQIEDREGIDAVDEIAAVEGIDLLFIGPGDLSQSYGIPLQFKNPILLEAKEKVIAAAERHGIWWGSPCGDLDGAREMVRRGARLVAMGADLFILMQEWQRTRAAFDAIVAEELG